MKVLVTGAAGFIGSSLSERLLSAGHTVVGVDCFNQTYNPQLKRWNLRTSLSKDGFSLAELDILNRDQLIALFELHRPDAVVHLAALAGVRPSIEQPALYQRVNVEGTTHVLDAARFVGVKHFIFGSSSSVYGERKSVPFSESDVVDHPVSPYAATKKAGELLCHTYHHLFDMDIDCLRFFTVYGARQRPEMAICKFANAMLDGRPITLFGDGSSARDYTFISDIVDGIERTLSNPDGYRVMNLGGEYTVTLSTLVATIASAINVEPKIEYLPNQAGDVSITSADVTRARSTIGYSPQVNLEEGIRRFVSWLKHTRSLPTER